MKCVHIHVAIHSNITQAEKETGIGKKTTKWEKLKEEKHMQSKYILRR